MNALLPLDGYVGFPTQAEILLGSGAGAEIRDGTILDIAVVLAISPS